MNAWLRLRYALGRWLVAPVIRLPKRMDAPKEATVSPTDADQQTGATERALIWRDAMRLAEQGASVVSAVVGVAEARALLHATDLSAPWESAARWDEARGGRSK